MPTKPKQRNWRPPGIEALSDFDALYSPETLDKILMHGPQFCTEDANQRLRATIFDIGLELYASGASSDRPSIPEKRAALEDVSARAISMISGLKNIDHDSRQTLAMMYGRDGDTFLNDLRQSLHRVIRMSRYAGHLIGPAPKGRPLNIALRSAVSNLLVAWRVAAGAEPALTPFHRFVESALTPIVGDVDFEGPCREILYGEKAGKRRPH